MDFVVYRFWMFFFRSLRAAEKLSSFSICTWVLFMVSGDYFFNRKSKALFLCLLTSSMFLAFIGEIKLLYIIIPIFIYISYVLLKRFSFAHIIVAVLLLEIGRAHV